SRWEFTNVACESFDKDFGEFDFCYLKSINRSYKYVSGKISFRTLPIKKLMINMALWKRFNGYKPFLYNVSFDLCVFIKKAKSNLLLKFVYDSMSQYSNVNTSCSSLNFFIVDKLPAEFVDYRFSKVLSFPKGDYLIKWDYVLSKRRIAYIYLYGTLS
ncbi:hypothetical protein KR018_010210, partial [Drosophila ironensis]